MVAVVAVVAAEQQLEVSVFVFSLANLVENSVRLLSTIPLDLSDKVIYSMTDRVGHRSVVHPYELAQYIYGPSYISLESVLSFHQLIPEMTLTVTSVATKRSRHFMTPLGQFSFQHQPKKNFYIGVERIEEDGHLFLMAKPWKAICDYIFCYKKDWKNLEPLSDSLRIDLEALPMLHDEEYALFEQYYHSTRINRFLKGIRKDLRNMGYEQ